MKIYTKTGDQGETGLIGGVRVPKCDARIETCGDIDELNSLIGLIRCLSIPDPIESIFESIQNELFQAGAVIACTNIDRLGTQHLTLAHVQKLEQAIDRLTLELSPLTHFVLPGGSESASRCHHARTVCRRAERRLVSFLDPQKSTLPAEKGAESRSQDSDALVCAHQEVLCYMNRLSDLLFVISRYLNHSESVGEILWKPPCP